MIPKFSSYILTFLKFELSIPSNFVVSHVNPLSVLRYIYILYELQRYKYFLEDKLLTSIVQHHYIFQNYNSFLIPYPMYYHRL